MINKRILGGIPGSMRYAIGTALLDWGTLIADILIITCIANMVEEVYNKTFYMEEKLYAFGLIALGVIVRYVCGQVAGYTSSLSTKKAKKALEEKLHSRMLSLEKMHHSEDQKPEIGKLLGRNSDVRKLAEEIEDQVENYFGAYMPQVFYGILALITLFIYLSRVSMRAAIVLLIFVPIIPFAIAFTQTGIKRLIFKYRKKRTTLSEHFWENLEGLTASKLFQKNYNAFSIVDLIAFCGAGLGIVLAVFEFHHENITISGALLITVLVVDFFVSFHHLGRYFHDAMKGSEDGIRVFRLLNMKEVEDISIVECEENLGKETR